MKFNDKQQGSRLALKGGRFGKDSCMVFFPTLLIFFMGFIAGTYRGHSVNYDMGLL
jgi:hypothetical protein